MNLEGGGAYGNNTFYYVYVYIVAGVPTFQISTTVPDVYRIFKSGGTTHKYLFSFVTNGIGNVARFYWDDGAMHLYNELGVVSGAPVVATSVSMAGYLPPHAKIAIVKSFMESTIAAHGTARIGPTPTDIAGGYGRQLFVGANSVKSETYDLALSEGQSFDHICNAATTTHALTIQGWKEK